jgi:hypothetical protein
MKLRDSHGDEDFDFIDLMMKAAGTAEISVNFYRTTWHNSPGDSIFNVGVVLGFPIAWTRT